MREIAIDSETTDLDPFDGHRVVGIGAVELINRSPTGQKLSSATRRRRRTMQALTIRSSMPS